MKEGGRRRESRQEHEWMKSLTSYTLNSFVTAPTAALSWWNGRRGREEEEKGAWLKECFH